MRSAASAGSTINQDEIAGDTPVSGIDTALRMSECVGVTAADAASTRPNWAEAHGDVGPGRLCNHLGPEQPFARAVYFESPRIAATSEIAVSAAACHCGSPGLLGQPSGFFGRGDRLLPVAHAGGHGRGLQRQQAGQMAEPSIRQEPIHGHR